MSRYRLRVVDVETGELICEGAIPDGKAGLTYRVEVEHTKTLLIHLNE